MKKDSKVILFIAESLDGYIATSEESLEWLFKTVGEGDAGYTEFYETIDTVIMGRRTYDWIIQKENENFPYKDKKCYVFSRTTTGRNEFVEFINEDILHFTQRIKENSEGNIWIVGGGELLQFFMKEKLVDELIITIAPTLIGRGIPLFRENDLETELILKDVKQFNQFAQLYYELK